jgi:hypothetical protein
MRREMSYNYSIYAGGEGPKLKHTDFASPPSWHFDDTSAPLGNRSPDLPPPGPERSRGFSRSASRPQAGFGWHYHPMVSLPPVSVAEVRSSPSMQLGASWVRCVRMSALLSHSFAGSDSPVRSGRAPQTAFAAHRNLSVSGSVGSLCSSAPDNPHGCWVCSLLCTAPCLNAVVQKNGRWGRFLDRYKVVAPGELAD